MNFKYSLFVLLVIVFNVLVGCKSSAVIERTGIKQSKKEILAIIDKVNNHWQDSHEDLGNAFWNIAAYHTGNMEAYKVTMNNKFLDYSMAWADKNQWMGAKSSNKSEWKYNYGENDKHVLFGDWQICFQTYIDLYNFTGKNDSRNIARAR